MFDSAEEIHVFKTTKTGVDLYGSPIFDIVKSCTCNGFFNVNIGETSNNDGTRRTRATVTLDIATSNLASGDYLERASDSTRWEVIAVTTDVNPFTGWNPTVRCECENVHTIGFKVDS